LIQKVSIHKPFQPTFFPLNYYRVSQIQNDVITLNQMFFHSTFLPYKRIKTHFVKYFSVGSVKYGIHWATRWINQLENWQKYIIQLSEYNIKFYFQPLFALIRQLEFNHRLWDCWIPSSWVKEKNQKMFFFASKFLSHPI